jgi:hypothetical protein
MFFATSVCVALVASAAASQSKFGRIFPLVNAAEKLRDFFEVQAGVDIDQQGGDCSTEYRSVTEGCSLDLEQYSDLVASDTVENGLWAFVSCVFWGLLTAVEIVVCTVAIGPTLWRSTLQGLTSVAVSVGLTVTDHISFAVWKVGESTRNVA